MVDMLVRIGILFVTLATVLPAEFTDTLSDGFTFLLVVYAIILAFFVLLELTGMDVLRGEQNEERAS